LRVVKHEGGEDERTTNTRPPCTQSGGVQLRLVVGKNREKDLGVSLSSFPGLPGGTVMDMEEFHGGEG
jgi:hypothetical protein